MAASFSFSPQLAQKILKALLKIFPSLFLFPKILSAPAQILPLKAYPACSRKPQQKFPLWKSHSKKFRALEFFQQALCLKFFCLKISAQFLCLGLWLAYLSRNFFYPLCNSFNNFFLLSNKRVVCAFNQNSFARHARSRFNHIQHFSRCDYSMLLVRAKNSKHWNADFFHKFQISFIIENPRLCSFQINNRVKPLRRIWNFFRIF